MRNPSAHVWAIGVVVLQHLFQICSKEEGRCVWEEANTISNPLCTLMQQFERSSKFPQCCEKVFSSRYLFSRVKPTRLPRISPPHTWAGKTAKKCGERGTRRKRPSSSPSIGLSSSGEMRNATPLRAAIFPAPGGGGDTSRGLDLRHRKEGEGGERGATTCV